MNMKNCALAFGVAMLLAGCQKKEEASQTQKEGTGKSVPVKIVDIVKREFEDRLRVQGTLEAKYYANVAPRLDGMLETISVDEGDVVEAGKTQLFVSDRVTRERNVQNARLAVAAQKQALQVAQASVDKARVELKKAALDKSRYVRLFELGNATANEKELYETQFEQAQAGVKYAEAYAASTEEQIKIAETSLEIAEKNLNDSLIYAPISGIVSSRRMEPGEYGEAGKTVLRIEDTKTLEAVAYIPAQYYGKVIPGKTKLRMSVDGQAIGEFTVSYRSPVVDPQLRTFEIKAIVPGDTARNVVPGAMTDITIVLVRREGLAVPTHSVMTRSHGEMIYLAQDGKAVPCNVLCGLANDGWTEVFAKGEGLQPAEGLPVIAEGHYQLSDNGKIEIQE